MSGYTEMWQKDRSAEAPTRLENLKELSAPWNEFESMAGFLEHMALVMDRDSAEALDAVSIMTLHSAKGLEFDTVFLPGWEEGPVPASARAGRGRQGGLEEERRLAYVGITRAKKRAKLYFASNRRIHGQWQSSIPSRFLDELPETGSYSTPGWQRAQRARQSSNGFSDGGGRGYQSARQKRQGPLTIEGELVAKSVSDTPSEYSVGERVFHIKFGYGAIKSIEGNKLTIDFEKAGQKKVIDSFVERH
jgi:DNA helicase-2/ATP-dependent DNA helicase PcrA